jgi:iron complex outermembrane recepter protein
LNSSYRQRIALKISGFATLVENAQMPTLILPDAITVTRNAGKLRSLGTEAELAVIPMKGLEVNYNFGYTCARFMKLELPQNGSVVSYKGNKQIFTPDLTSMLALQYTYSFGTKQQWRLFVRSEWFYLGQQYFDLANTIIQKPYHLLNGKTGLLSKHVDVSFWVRNLLNTTFISYAYDFGAVHLGNPRTFGGTVTARF